MKSPLYKVDFSAPGRDPRGDSNDVAARARVGHRPLAGAR